MIESFGKTVRILGNALRSIDEQVFTSLVDQSVATLRAGNKIIVSGLGKNVPICEKFVGTMLSLGLPSYFMHTNSAMHGDVGVVHDGDLVIVLTKSGETTESVALVHHLRGWDILVWLISFRRGSRLATEIPNGIFIDLEHEGDPWDIMPNNSTTIYLILLQELAMQIGLKMDIPLTAFRKNHPGGDIGTKLSSLQEVRL